MSVAPETHVTEDFLDEDAEISGQKFVLLSFLSPENVLENKDKYFFERFLKNYELEWKTKNLEKFLVDFALSFNRELDTHSTELEKGGQKEAFELCRKHMVNVENVLNQYRDFVKTNQKELSKTSIKDAWDDFIFKERVKLEDEFYEINEFRTSVRGLKVRGVFGNQKEAEFRAKKLQSKDKYHNILLGEVGKWLPWDPSSEQIKEQEYAEERLNTLMKKYKENEEEKERHFEDRKQKMEGSVNKKNFEAKSLVISGDGDSSYDSMFSSQGDLAMRRKVELQTENSVVRPNQTSEKSATTTVSESETTLSV